MIEIPAPARIAGGTHRPGRARTNDRPRVLIASASAGTGHVTAARALASAFDSAGVHALHIDILELAPRWLRSAYGGGFELLASRAPALWREVYRRSDGGDADAARWGAAAQRLMFPAFDRLLAEGWSACVCTHFLPAQLAAGRTHVPFATVITDFTLHRYWVQRRVPQYYVAMPELARELYARLPDAGIIASGIPVGPGFSRRLDREQARVRLGLRMDRRIALVMGGGMGIGVEQAAFAALDTRLEGVQVVAVCGRNRAAFERLRSTRHGPDRLRVIGYSDDIAALISAADVVVTKPGGLTCSEALAMGTPLVLTNPLPGHEEANMEYLSSRGAAIAAPSPASVTGALRNLLGDSAVLAAYTRRAHFMGMPGAARAIAGDVLRRFTRLTVD